VPTISGSKKTKNARISKCPSPFNPLPLAALGVNELLDLDVGFLCRESEWEVEDDEWDDGTKTKILIIEPHTGGGG